MHIKKLKSVFIGIGLGFIISILLIINTDNDDLYLADAAIMSPDFYQNLIAASDNLDWAEVFGMRQGKDLYLMINNKLVHRGKNDALNELKSNYGFSLQEMEQILAGSIRPIFENPDRKMPSLTQAEAFDIQRRILDDYNFMKEIFELEQEIDVMIAPSEIFSNGDLSDSGFDLIYDLRNIEKILFLDSPDVTVGGTFPFAPKSPLGPVQDSLQRTFWDEYKRDVDDARLALEVADDDLDIDELDLEDFIDIEQDLIDKINVIGDDVEVLPEDICKTDEDFIKALDEYKDDLDLDDLDLDDLDPDDLDPDDLDPDDLDPDDLDPDDLDPDDLDPDDPDDEEEIAKSIPAPESEWRKVWCPGFDEGEDSVGAYYALDYIKSMGELFTEDKPPAQFQAGTGAGYSYQHDLISLDFAACITVDMITERLYSYHPGDSCIQCEIEGINEILDETLSQSLVPNKTTGMFMASGKCTDLPAINFDPIVITIWSPIPTPDVDDLIYSKNIYENFVSFLDKNILMKPREAKILKKETDTMPAETTQLDLFDSIADTRAFYISEAQMELKNVKLGEELGDKTVFSDTLLREMKQMNEFFIGFKNLFQRTHTEAIKEIERKPYLN